MLTGIQDVALPVQHFHPIGLVSTKGWAPAPPYANIDEVEPQSSEILQSPYCAK